MTDSWKYFERYAYGPPIFPDYELPRPVSMVIVLPSFRETDLSRAIQSLINCEPPGFEVVILVVVNESGNSDELTRSINQQSINDLQGLIIPSFMYLKVHFEKLPPKKAGVGLARKIGMDEAARWFTKTQRNGIITCFDADCLCSSNFLKAIGQKFQDGIEAGVVFFEHPLDHEAIEKYELFLRYHIDSLRWANFPFAYQTLGSCISVKVDTYLKHGGMNTRKAGEDFYFLHKIIPHCHFAEINDTTIYPAPRRSDRVPFGTGKAVSKIAEQRSYEVYSPRAFQDLKVLFENYDLLYSGKSPDLPHSVQEFHDENRFDQALEEMKRHSPTFETFKKKFFTWWDAFRALKYVHFARDHYYPSIPLAEALLWLDHEFWNIGLEREAPKTNLIKIRDWDRNYQSRI